MFWKLWENCVKVGQCGLCSNERRKYCLCIWTVLNSQYSVSLELENNKEQSLSFFFFLTWAAYTSNMGFSCFQPCAAATCIFVFLPLVLVLHLFVSSWEDTYSIPGRGWCWGESEWEVWIPKISTSRYESWSGIPLADFWCFVNIEEITELFL